MKIRSLVPMLETENLTQTVEFYQTHFGFECRGKYPPENPCWVSLWNGETEIAFNLPNAHQEFTQPKLTGSLYLTVENVAEIWAKLKDSNVEIVYPLADMNYGMREFGIKDCNGYILNIGQNIP